MSGMIVQNKRNHCKSMRDHDYIFDDTFTVPCEKDHYKFINRAAKATTETTIVPIYEHMFSDLQKYPSTTRAYIPNAHLPEHIDLGFKDRTVQNVPTDVAGRYRFKFFTKPKIVLKIGRVVAEIPAPNISMQLSPRGRSVDRSVQTIYRESSTQTDPYQPEFVIKNCKITPDVLLLDEIKIDAEDVARGVDLSVARWINVRRAKRAWSQAKPTFSVLSDLEYYEQHLKMSEIERALAGKLEKSNYIEKIHAKTDVDIPKRLWTVREQNLDRTLNRIDERKERDIRKLHAKRFWSNTESDLTYPLILPKLPTIVIDTNFLPTPEQLLDRLPLFDSVKTFDKIKRRRRNDCKYINLLNEYNCEFVRRRLDSLKITFTDSSDESLN